MDNLRRSIADRSKNMHLNLKNEGSNNVLLINLIEPMNHFFEYDTANEFSHVNFALCGNQCHVKGATVYMVGDDLSVAQLAMSSRLSVLNELKISVSDVEEMELQVGLEEGLSIPKAALTSITALTDGLIKLLLKKQPKQQMGQQIGNEL